MSECSGDRPKREERRVRPTHTDPDPPAASAIRRPQRAAAPHLATPGHAPASQLIGEPRRPEPTRPDPARPGSTRLDPIGADPSSHTTRCGPDIPDVNRTGSESSSVDRDRRVMVEL